MDVMLRQMPVTVKTGAVISRAHVEMQEKVETLSQPSRLQPEITNASSVKLVTEASKSFTTFPQPCSESKIVTNSANRRPLIFSPSKSFISDSLKFFRSIKHDKGGKKTKNLGCAEVPVSKYHMVFTSALAIKEDNLLEVDSATKIKPLLMPVENFSELGLTKRVRKTNYVNTAVQNLTGWLHSVWSYRSPRPFSKSHTTSVAPDELHLCNDCEQQILSELLRSNNIQIAVRYATPEGLWQENKTADIISSKVAAEGPESGYLVKDPIVEHDQESFSRFLHKVPLAEIKTVSHLADLCSLAYMIPEMKTGDLLSQHKLKFVTSSLDRKAQASEKEKAANKVISLSANESQNMIEASISNDACSLSSSVWYTATSGAPSCSLPDGNSVFQLECEKSDVGNGLRAQIFNALFPVDVKIAKNVVHGQVFSSLGHGKNFAASECYAKHHSLDDLPQSTPKASLLQPCPCGWFCCDDIAARTRYFVIQGSESLASWQANLAFEPVQFEDASLGVLVHRGIYEAAKGLYQQLLPDIIEHLKKHGNAGRIRFTGHSLGGNLATLLFMMLRIRKTVTADVLLPVVTFGSPSIMCGGDNILEKLSIPQSHIQSVVMHRDIVPRSFSCHYPDHIAEVLKRIYGVFRQHACLIHQRLLYTPMGDFYILQPDEGIAPPHPFLPEGSGLYLMRHPIQPQDSSKISVNAMELQTALRAFFNSPHPLEILGNPGSYGSNGSIARNHDPRSYTKALDIVLLQELERQMHKKSKKNRQLWWPLFAALSSVENIGGLGVIQSQASRGAISSTVGVMHHELRQSVSSAMRGGQHMSVVTALGANLSRHVRYKRLIASQHVQIGIFFILSAKVVLLQAPLAVVAWV